MKATEGQDPTHLSVASQMPFADVQLKQASATGESLIDGSMHLNANDNK